MVAKVENKNIYNTNRRHTDRNKKPSEFPEFDVKIIKISTVMLLLEAQEDDVVERALCHLDKFASLGSSQLEQLHNNRLYESISTLVINSNNVIVKKFSFKLLAQLIHVFDECRKKLLNDANLIGETRNIFITSADDNLVEFSCILLHYICDDPKNVDALGRDEIFMGSLFNHFHSHDPDILLQSLRLLNIIMQNSMLITFILSMKDFPFKNLEIELKNDCREIQFQALESIFLISNICSEHSFKNEFTSSDRLIEVVYDICKQHDFQEAQKLALKIYRNICKDEKVLANRSKNLSTFIEIFKDKNSLNREEILGVLTEFALYEDNRKVLIENEVTKIIIEMLKNASISACCAVNVMRVNLKFQSEILESKIYEILLANFKNEDKKWETREIFLKTLKNIINIQGLSHLIESSLEMSKCFSQILQISPPVNISITLISILDKLATYLDVKEKIATDELAKAVCTSISSRHSMLIIQLLHLIANYIDQQSFRDCFIKFSVYEFLANFLKSTVYQVRVSACNLINMAANYPELSLKMINEGILKMLLHCFECTICADGFEKMLNYDMSLKFSIRRRLEVSDKIKDGFYASKKEIDFMNLKKIMDANSSSPFFPIYTVNFEDEIKIVSSLNCPSRSILSDKCIKTLHDSLANESNFNSAEIHEKIKILAIRVGKFLQTDDECTSHIFNMHLMELKFKFASSVVPIGSLIYGNSFEAALLFKAMADRFDIKTTFVSSGCKAWNEVCDGNNIVDLFFAMGEIYNANGHEARKYLQKIS